jgi:hypothetical protein
MAVTAEMVRALCDREVAECADPDRAAKVKFLRDYFTDPHFRAALEDFIAARAANANITLEGHHGR